MLTRLAFFALRIALTWCVAPLSSANAASTISQFSSISVAATNFQSEAVVTNGFTLGGVRNTAWPSDSWTNLNGSAILRGSISNIFAAGNILNVGIEDSSNLINVGPQSGFLNTGTSNLFQSAAISFNFGEAAGYQCDFQGANHGIMNWGVLPGAFCVYSNANNIFNIGEDVGMSATYVHSDEIYNFGEAVGQYSTYTNSERIIHYGTYTGYKNSYNNSRDVYIFGTSRERELKVAGTTLTGVTNFFCIGGALESSLSQILDVTAVLSGPLAASVVMTNVQDAVLTGYDPADFTTIADSSYIFTYGAFPLYNATVKGGSTYIHSYDYGLDSAVLNGASEIYGFGYDHLHGAKLTNSTDVFAIGAGAATGLTGTGKNHIFVIGSGAKATNANDFVVGDTAYNYFFPGASMRIENVVTGVKGFSSIATDAFLAMTATGRTNTLGKNAVARFDGTNLVYVVKDNANTPVYTNSIAVGRSTELLQAGGAIVITSGGFTSGTVSPF